MSDIKDIAKHLEGFGSSEKNSAENRTARGLKANPPKDGKTIYDLIGMRDRGEFLTTRQKKRITQHFWVKNKRQTDPEYVERQRQLRRNYETKRYNEDEEWRNHRNRNRILMKYNMPDGGYDGMLEAQGGRCAICNSTDARSRSDKFHIDHCHKTGVVRGLLCGPCNGGIGKLRDDPNLLRIAIKYLERAGK